MTSTWHGSCYACTCTTSSAHQFQIARDRSPSSVRLSKAARPSPSSLGRAATQFCECGDHAFAAVGRGLNVLVSPADAAVLDRKWFASISHGGYVTVARNETVSPGKRQKVVLARAVAAPEPMQEVDHINGDCLDNRRQNLRTCSRAENAKNVKRHRTNSVGFKGVRKNRNRFVAYIRSDNIRHHLGSFASPEEAHAAYVEAAKRLHGEFARFE